MWYQQDRRTNRASIACATQDLQADRLALSRLSVDTFINMRSFLSSVLWPSTVVSAQQVITIMEWRKCSTSAVFSVPTSTSPQTSSNSTQTLSQPASSSSSSAATSSATRKPNPFAVVGGVGALSPTAQGNVDNLFWLNYGKAIMEAAKVRLTGTNAFFIGSEAQKGPVAGSNIPEEYTNLGLHAIANSLLNNSTRSTALLLRTATLRH
jgi:hypothetical protein